MDAILGLKPTGRELRDPAARLVEATDADGRTYTVVGFDAAHQGHPALTLNVEMVLSFMEYPMVTGLVELGKHDVAAGQFAYPTGSVWLLADVLRAYGDFGQVVGLRAAMELAWLVGQILVEAGSTGPMQGCFSHGNLNPWRIALRADGEVQVLGYGLPQVELIRHRDGDGPSIDAVSLRYCPPERLEGVPEDPAADTYALTLVAFEVATGKPLYSSFDVPTLERTVGMSEGANMLSRDDLGLPTKVAKLLARSLVYDPDTRLSGQAYVDAIGALLASEPMDGPSLTDVVNTLQGRQRQGGPPKGRKLVSTAATSAFTPEMLAEMADDDDDDDDDSPEEDGRWKKVERSRRSASPEADASSESEDTNAEPRRARRRADADEPAATRKRRRRKAAEAPSRDAKLEAKPEPEPEAQPVPAADAPPDPEPTSSEPAPSSRRQRKPPEDDPAPTTSSRRRKAPEADAEESPTKSSRKRRRKPAEEAPPEAGEAPARRRRPVDDDDDDATPRRRRRASTDDDDDDDAPPRRRRKAP